MRRSASATDLALPRVRIVSGPPHATTGIELTATGSLDPAVRTFEPFRFTAPSNAILKPTTTYWIVVEAADNGGDVRWSFSGSANQAGFAYWSIGDLFQERGPDSEGAFATHPDFVGNVRNGKLRINGIPE